MVWLLILLTGNITQPIPYTSKSRCEEAGKIFSEDMNRLHIHYRCIPNDHELRKGKD